MTCRELAEVLLEFVAGDLQPECVALVEQHLCICEACDAYVHSYRVTIVLTKKLQPRPLPAGLAERLESLLRQAEKDGRGGDV